MEINEQGIEELHLDEIVETKDEQGNDTTDWKAIALQNQGIAKRLKTKIAKMAEKPQEAPKEVRSDDSLLSKAFLRSAGITKREEVELALSTAKKWGVDIDQLVDDEDFQAKLEKLRTSQANVAASANVQGDKTGTPVKETADYWVAKGTPPTPVDIPNRETRTKIIREMMKLADTGGKKFYND